MVAVNVRCYAELNDALPSVCRYRTFVHRFEAEPSVRQLVHDLRLSPDQVDLALVNGEPAGWNLRLNNGDRVSLYPVFESFDISTVTRLRTLPLRQPRFVADVHLGKLAKHLRMLGFDTAYSTQATDVDLSKLAVEEERTLLSKDRKLLQDEALPRRYCVNATDARLQLIEVMRRFDLAGCIRPFTRCIECNTSLESVPKSSVIDRLPPRVKEAYDEFKLCPRCDRVYWQGSHYQRMLDFVSGVIGVLKQRNTGEM